MIITDCCYAGNWASQGLHKVQVEYNHTVQDVGDGGQFTLALLEFYRGVNLDSASCEYGGSYLRQTLTMNGESSPVCNVAFKSSVTSPNYGAVIVAPMVVPCDGDCADLINANILKIDVVVKTHAMMCHMLLCVINQYYSEYFVL